MVPPAVNTPQAIALALVEDAEVVTNWKCSVLLLVLLAVLALAAVMLLPATTAANASVPPPLPKLCA